MYVNGIVIQQYVSNPYKGIDGCGWSTGCNWYFNYDEQLSASYEPFYDEYIGKTFWNLKDHYAYAGGDNYSAVYNEIPSVFPQFKLNSNGLFDTEEEIKEFILEREKFKKAHPPYTLEAGDFVVFRLHEVYLN